MDQKPTGAIVFLRRNSSFIFFSRYSLRSYSFANSFLSSKSVDSFFWKRVDRRRELLFAETILKINKPPIVNNASFKPPMSPRN